MTNQQLTKKDQISTKLVDTYEQRLKEIDVSQVIDEDKWLDYEPSTKLGKEFFEWSGSNLPRHMGTMDWNRPWAVAHTMKFEQLLSSAITEAEELVYAKGYED